MSVDLWVEIQKKVSLGELTYSEVLEAIREVKEESYNISWLMSQLDATEEDLISHFPMAVGMKASPNSAEQFREGPMALIPDSRPNPERLAERLEFYESLSEGARQVATICCQATPDDFRQGRYGKDLCHVDRRGNVTIAKRSVYRVLREKLGWPTRMIEKVFDELRTYSRNIEALG